jgi:hypothetical protein
VKAEWERIEEFDPRLDHREDREAAGDPNKRDVIANRAKIHGVGARHAVPLTV